MRLDGAARCATVVQNRAWHPANDAEVSFFHDHVDDPQLLVNRLRPYDVVVAMRERTPFPGDVLQALPTLRLLVATGMHHQTIDFDAATAAGITVCGTQSTDG